MTMKNGVVPGVAVFTVFRLPWHILQCRWQSACNCNEIRGNIFRIERFFFSKHLDFLVDVRYNMDIKVQFFFLIAVVAGKKMMISL